MLDAHSRLSEVNGFAIGTLLGTVTADGSSKSPGGVIVEVVDCFANPFHWDRTTTALTIQKDPHEWMLKLREKINPKLSVVGWCCTTSTILYTTALSDWAQSEQKVSRFQPSKTLPEPVHLLIDPTFQTHSNIMAATKAYVRGPLRELFHEVQLEMALNPSDIHGAAGIIKASTGRDGTTPEFLDGTSTSLPATLKKVRSTIDHCLDYVDKVLTGEIEGDASLGRKLMRAVCIDTLLPKQEVERMLEGSIEDNLMVAYLVNLARLQFAAAERLNTSFT